MDQEEKQRNYDIAEVLLSEQNFPAAVIVGTAVYTITGLNPYRTTYSVVERTNREA